jgi:hypothetical protein
MTSSVSQFNEGMYLAFYNDLDSLVPTTYATGLDHYRAVGQFFGPNKKESFFTGDSGNNIITGFGDDIDLYGVSITATFTSGSGPNGPATFTPASFGIGERDTLVGRNSAFHEDGFFLSVPNGEYSRTNATTGMLFGQSSRLYVGQGNRDYARVVNFNKEYDYVSLSGAAKDYNYRYQRDNQAPGGYSLKIYTKAENDLVGIVEGINDLQPRNFIADGTFRLSGRIPARGFNDDVYDKLNNVTGGLEHYVTTGQNTSKTGVFSGAPSGSPTLNSSTPANGNDTIIAYGGGNNRTIISGVGLSIDSNQKIIAEGSLGTNQVDVLIGALNTRDDYWLGVDNDSLKNGQSQALYVGGGTADYGRIQNYQEKDRVIFAGSASDYTYNKVSTGMGSEMHVSLNGDLVGIIEGVEGILSSSTLANDTFAVRFDVI